MQLEVRQKPLKIMGGSEGVDVSGMLGVAEGVTLEGMVHQLQSDLLVAVGGLMILHMHPKLPLCTHHGTPLCLVQLLQRSHLDTILVVGLLSSVRVQKALMMCRGSAPPAQQASTLI